MRALVGIVIVLAVLIFFGILALVYGIVNKVGLFTQPGPAVEESVPLPSGTRILETTVGDGHIVLRVETPEGKHALVILDLATGKRRATVQFGP